MSSTSHGRHKTPLDRNRPYGTVHGDPLSRHFEQDGAFFHADGSPWSPSPNNMIDESLKGQAAYQQAPAQRNPRTPPAAIRLMDWASIEADYRAGNGSIRALAKRAGVTEGAIRKRARTRGWTRDAAPRG